MNHTVFSGRVFLCDYPRVVVKSAIESHTFILAPETQAPQVGQLVTIYQHSSSNTVTWKLVHNPTVDAFRAGSDPHRFLLSGLGQNLFLRAEIKNRIRDYFQSQRSLEVETPIMVRSPGLDVHLSAFAVNTHREALHHYLITSPEYHMKRLLVGGIDRCYQFVNCFRQDEVGARHEPEFTMLEWYRAWDDLETMLAETEAIVRIASSLSKTPGYLSTKSHKVSVFEDFERLTIREAFARYAPEVGDPIELAQSDEVLFFKTLNDKVEPNLGNTRPTWLLRWPSCHASLAKIASDDPTVAERFELYIAGIEICNGFVELTDPHEQRSRLLHDQQVRKQANLPVYPIDERFLTALQDGMPPSVGCALGFDRLVMLVTGSSSIDQVMAFGVMQK